MDSSSSKDPAGDKENGLNAADLPEGDARAASDDQQVWNAVFTPEEDGEPVAAYDDGITVMPIVLTDGMTLPVAQGAAGTLTVPADVNNLVLTGPGLENPITSKGKIRIDNTNAASLSIADLSMSAGAEDAFLSDLHSHNLNLNLDNVLLTGGTGGTGIDAGDAGVTLNASNSVTLAGGTGEEAGGHGIRAAKRLEINGSLTAQGGNSGNEAGSGIVAGMLVVNGSAAAKSGEGATGSAAGLFLTGSNNLEINENAVLTLTGETGIQNPGGRNMSLSGSLTIDAKGTVLTGGTVIFTSPAATLAVQSAAGRSVIHVALNAGLAADHELYSTGGVTLNVDKTTATVTAAGTVAVGGPQVWNAEKNGLAAYTDADLGITTPISLTDGKTLQVTQTAAGTLDIPLHVTSLTLVGPGLETPVSGSGQVTIRLGHTVALKITDLNMHGGNGQAFLAGDQSGQVTLELDNVDLSGGTAIGGTMTGGSGIALPRAGLELTAKNSVTVSGGGGTRKGGSGVEADRLTLRGSLTLTGGDSSGGTSRGVNGAGIAANSIQVESGTVTAQSGRGGVSGDSITLGNGGVLQTDAGTLLNATGYTGINMKSGGTVKLAGRMQVTSTDPDGSAVSGGSIVFTDPAARLTLKEAVNPRTVQVDLSPALSKDYRLYALEGVQMKSETSAVTSSVPGTVYVGRGDKVWNAQTDDGRAAYMPPDASASPIPIEVTDGMELTVTQGAAGWLTIPGTVEAFALTGPGLDHPVSTQGGMLIEGNEKDVTLNITGLAMEAGPLMAFAAYMGTHSLTLNLKDVALTGGEDGTAGQSAINAPLSSVALTAEGSVVLTGGKGLKDMAGAAAGSGLAAKNLVLQAGSVTAVGGQCSQGQGSGVFLMGSLHVKEGASLTATGGSGVYYVSVQQQILLGGSLTATATHAQGDAVKMPSGGTFLMSGPSAALTVQESAGNSNSISVKLDPRLQDSCELYARGGVTLNSARTLATTSDQPGVVGARELPVWNASWKGVAAYQEGDTITPLELTDGTVVRVEEGASGALTVPDGVNTLTLTGKGKDNRITSPGRVEIKNPQNTILNIKNLNMSSGSASPFLFDSQAHSLTLNLTDVSLSGSAASGPDGLSGNAVDVMQREAQVTINAENSVILTGGAGTDGEGGNGIYVYNLTVNGPLKALGGSSAQGMGGAGIAVQNFTMASGHAAAQGGAGKTRDGMGVTFLEAGGSLTVQKGAALTAEGHSGIGGSSDSLSIALGGRLTAAATSRNGSSVFGCTVTFTDTAAVLTATEVSVGSRIAVELAAELAGYRLEALGTALMMEGSAEVQVRTGTGTVSVGRMQPQWNAVLDGAAAYNDGATTQRLTLTDGMTLKVREGAAGTLRVPAGVGSLTLAGPGLTGALTTNGQIEITNPQNLSLAVTGLAMQAQEGKSFLTDTQGHTLILALDNAALTGGDGAPGVDAGQAELELSACSSVTITGGAGADVGGHGVTAGALTVTAGQAAVQGGRGAAGDGAGAAVAGSLQVAQGASLSAQGESGVTGGAALEGSLTAVSTASGGKAVGGPVTFKSAAARLTVQEYGDNNGVIPVALDAALTAEYELFASGGVTLNEEKTEAATSGVQGEVTVGAAQARPIWNTQKEGRAAYTNGIFTLPLVLTDGMTLTVEEGASGTLTVPADVNTLTLQGPGQGVTMEGANIVIGNRMHTTLNITGLAMQAKDGESCLWDTQYHPLTLNLTDVTFTGGAGASALATGRAETELTVNAAGSVILAGGHGANDAGGPGIDVLHLTVNGELAAWGGGSTGGDGGAGIRTAMFTVASGSVTALGGAGAVQNGAGVFFAGYSTLTVQEGAAMTATGRNGIEFALGGRPVTLGGSLTATSDQQGAAIRNEAQVIFTTSSAELRGTQYTDESVRVKLDTGLMKDYRLEARGGAALDVRRIRASFSEAAGTVFVGKAYQVWNSELGGKASYIDGGGTRHALTLTDGMTLEVEEGAGGTLTIPHTFTSFTLQGPGLQSPIYSKGCVAVERSGGITLTVTGLSMKALNGTPFLTASGSNPGGLDFELVLDDVSLTGGAGVNDMTGSECAKFPNGALSLTARNSVTLTGGGSRGNGIHAGMIDFNGGELAVTSPGGSAIYASSLRVEAGKVTATSHKDSSSPVLGIAVYVGANVSVAKDASLTATGDIGLYCKNSRTFSIGGRLTAVSTHAGGQAIYLPDGAKVIFVSEGATLTTQESNSHSFPVALAPEMEEDYRLYASGGMKLENGYAFTSSVRGSVMAGGKQMWNAGAGGKAAFFDGKTTTPITVTDGMRLMVLEGAAGTLTVPRGVGSLTLSGLGLDTAVTTKGSIRLENPADTALSIRGLAMRAPDGAAFLSGSQSHVLTLELTDVSLTGLSAVAAPQAEVRLTAQGSVSLSGSGQGDGVSAGSLLLHGSFGAAAQSGAAMSAKETLTVASGSVTARGARVRCGQLTVEAGASLETAGVAAAEGIALGGSLTAVAGSAGGQAVEGAVTFTHQAAILAVQEFKDCTGAIPVALDAGLPGSWELLASGGAALNGAKTEAATSDVRGTVTVAVKQVWNAETGGKAAYSNGETAVPIVLHSGMALDVAEGAAGRLYIPAGVDTLTLQGPGLSRPINTKGDLRVENPGDMELNIIGLAMQASYGSLNSWISDPQRHTLTLGLDNVALTGSDHNVAGGAGIYASQAAVEITAKNSVVLRGGDSAKTSGAGIWADSLTVRGSLTARGGDGDQGGALGKYIGGIVLNDSPLNVLEGDVTAIGGRGRGDDGIGVFFNLGKQGEKNLYVAAGASLDTSGSICVSNADEITLGGSLKATATRAGYEAIRGRVTTFTDAAARLTVREATGNTRDIPVALDTALADDYELYAAGGMTLDDKKTTATPSDQEGTVAVRALYVLTVEGSAGGSVSGAAPGRYGQGETLTVTAEPEPGCLFTGWTAAGLTLTEEEKDARTLDFTMPAGDVALTAGFEPVPPATYIITAAAGLGGSITPAGDVTVTEGDDQSFTVTPDKGYQVKEVLADGVPVTLTGDTYTLWSGFAATPPEGHALGDAVKYSFGDVRENHTIEASFAPTVPPHVHDYRDNWSFDAVEHWHECKAGDGARADEAAHTPGDWVLDQAATETQAGLRHKQCTVCGYVTQIETLPPTGPVYTYRTLTDPATGVSVSGYFSADAALLVGDGGLHPAGECGVCEGIRARQAAGELLALYDIGLSAGKYTGTLEVAIPVGAAFDGKTLLVLHCRNKVLESRSLTVENGAVKGTFNSLSPFGVVQVSEDEPIITGLPREYAMYVDQTVVWKPEPAGGTWSFDENLLSITGNGDDYHVKALKPGRATATYEVNKVLFTVDVIINGNVPPQTDDTADPPAGESIGSPPTGDSTLVWPWLTLMFAALLGCAGLLVYRKRSKKT